MTRQRRVGLRRRPALGHRPRERRRGRGAVARAGRRADGPHPAARRQGQLLADGRHRPVRSVLGDPHRPGPRVRPRRRARCTTRTATGSWSSGTSCSCSSTRRPTARARRCPKPSVDTGAGLERILALLQGVDSVWETDLMMPLIEAAQSVTGKSYRVGDYDASRQLRDARARRARPLVDDARQRRRVPVERGPRVRAAPHHPPRRAVRVPARHRAARDATPRRDGDRRHGQRVPRRREEPRLRARRAHPRGGALPSHAEDRARHPRRRDHRPVGGCRAVGLDRVPAARHLRLPARAHAGDRRRALDRRRHRRVRDRDERPAHARQGGAQGRRRPTPISTCTARSSSSSAPPSSSATSATSRTSRVLAVAAQGPTTPSRSSSTARRSTPSRAARSATPARSRPTPGGPRSSTPPRRSRTCGGTPPASSTGTITVGQEATARIDVERRNAIRRNHTGTHLLHWALRRVLGDHVKQAGSWVGPDRLRFDFSHYEAVTPEQITEIERLVNAETLRNERARSFETTKTEAEAMGAIAFFGDKYGDLVRVLEAGPSVELCGGTHVSATGDIGMLKVVSESSIGSNLRRIEAVTGAASVELLQHDEALIGEIGQLVGTTTGDVVAGVQRKLDEIKTLQSELKQLRVRSSRPDAPPRSPRAPTDGIVVQRLDGLEPGDLRDLAIAVRQQPGIRRVVLMGATPSGGVGLVVGGAGRARASRPPTSSSPRRAPSAAVAAARATSPRPEARTRRASTRPCASRRRPPPRERATAGAGCGRSVSTPAPSESVSRSATCRARSPRHCRCCSAAARRATTSRELARIARDEEAEVIVVGLPHQHGRIARRVGKGCHGLRRAARYGVRRAGRDARRASHQRPGRARHARRRTRRARAPPARRQGRRRDHAAVVARRSPEPSVIRGDSDTDRPRVRLVRRRMGRGRRGAGARGHAAPVAHREVDRVEHPRARRRAGDHRRLGRLVVPRPQVDPTASSPSRWRSP